MINFDWTISLGAVIQTIVLLGGILSWGAKINHDVAVIKGDIRSLQNISDGFGRSFDQISKVLTQVAVQDIRILNVEKDVDDLRHHKGFVND
jgi:hypothetical protein